MQIQIPKYFNKSEIAHTLYPNLSRSVAAAKLHNKINGECRAKLTQEEINKIKEIIK